MRAASSHPLTGFAIVLGAAALFGTLGPLSRFAYEAGLEPASFVAWRALVGALAAMAFVAWQVRRGRERLVRMADLAPRARLLLGVAAVAGFTLNLAMFIAFDLVTIALALLAFYTYPAIVAVVAVVLGRERLDRPKLVALGLALAGMVAVVAGQLDPAGGIVVNWLGIALALSAALSQATFVTISKDGYSEVPTDQAQAVVLAVSAVCAGGVAILAGRAATLAFPLTNPDVLPLVLFAGVFAATLPGFGFLAGIRRIGGLRAGILMLFEPVVGVALAALLLNEGLQLVQVAGGLAILAAAIIVQRSAGEEPEIEPQATPVPDPLRAGARGAP